MKIDALLVGWRARDGVSDEVGRLLLEQPQLTFQRSDVQGIEVARSVGKDPGHGERAEAGVPIVAFAFPPFEGWLETVVNREEQGRVEVLIEQAGEDLAPAMGAHLLEGVLSAQLAGSIEDTVDQMN